MVYIPEDDKEDSFKEIGPGIVIDRHQILMRQIDRINRLMTERNVDFPFAVLTLEKNLYGEIDEDYTKQIKIIRMVEERRNHTVDVKSRGPASSSLVDVERSRNFITFHAASDIYGQLQSLLSRKRFWPMKDYEEHY